MCCLISNREGLGRVCSLWDKQHESDIVRKSTLRLETFFKFGVYWAYVEQDKAIHKKYIMSGQCVLFISYKFSSFLIAVSCSGLARLTPNLSSFLTSMCYFLLCGSRVEIQFGLKLGNSSPHLPKQSCRE